MAHSVLSQPPLARCCLRSQLHVLEPELLQTQVVQPLKKRRKKRSVEALQCLKPMRTTPPLPAAKLKAVVRQQQSSD